MEIGRLLSRASDWKARRNTDAGFIPLFTKGFFSQVPESTFSADSFMVQEGKGSFPWKLVGHR